LDCAAEAERVETASNGHTALLRAFDAVASGRCKRVIAIGGEKMSAVERDQRSLHHRRGDRSDRPGLRV